MTKSITVDLIENRNGDRLLTNGYPARPNRILEHLSGPCDGSEVTVASGTYILPTVTTQQTGTTAYQTVSGSEIFYCPPPGTKKVVYEFTYSVYWVVAHAINDYKFYIDNTEVTNARHNRSSQYIENKYKFNWTIGVGDTDSPANAKFLTWNTPKRLYMMFRIYGTSNYSNHHGTTYWDGASSNQFSMPHLSIIATT